MQEFKYSVKGTADETPNAGIVKAKDKTAALAKLKALYGDGKSGVQVQLITDAQFAAIEAEKGEQLTHRPE